MLEKFPSHSWGRLAVNAFLFSCESCVEQMTKADYGDSFSAAAQGLLQSYMFHTEKLALISFLCEAFCVFFVKDK